MTFEEWLTEPELYSTREERFYELLDHFDPKKTSHRRMMYSWLEAAYNEGLKHDNL